MFDPAAATPENILARIERLYKPYHAALRGLVERAQRQFGYALLVDCHSMPSHGQPGRLGQRQADFVLGDAHGTACSPRITRFVERTLSDLGYSVRRNDPYAGGFITRHYGRPRERVHALQIEITRELYMDEARIERLPRFGATREDIGALIERITAEAASLLAG